MHVVTAQQMRNLDRCTIDSLGIPALVLMENAGREAARTIQALYPDVQGAWLILAGKGNNGGDGLVAARHLAEWGCRVQILYAENPENFTGEAAIQRDIAARLGIPSTVYQAGTTNWQNFSGIVDALLGTGAKGAPREPYASLIREANASEVPIVALDIPSGLNTDSGQTWEPCIRARSTVAFGFLKQGLAQYPGVEAAGDVTVVPIGIPAWLAQQAEVQTFLLDSRVFREQLEVDLKRRRRMDTHKGTYGHALVAAGTRRMSGAGLLCCQGALRTGCGLVTWALPDRILGELLGRVPEAMLAGISDGGLGDWSLVSAKDIVSLAQERDAAAIGPGMGRFLGGEELIRSIWEEVSCPIVIDADALNLMADSFQSWNKRSSPAILTPHPGEMARLTRLTVKQVQESRIEIARQFAIEHGVTLVLKGARTVIAAPDGRAFINPTGNPGMATGGTGDVLAGVLVSLLAQGYEALQAACLGVFLHGTAGDLAAGKKGMDALLASDVVEEIGGAIDCIRQLTS